MKEESKKRLEEWVQGNAPSSAVLHSAWTHIATKCAFENAQFMECKKKDRNPAACVDCGDKVVSCVSGVLKDLNSKCGDEFDAYSKCMHFFHNKFDQCRPEQHALEKAYTNA